MNGNKKNAQRLADNFLVVFGIASFGSGRRQVLLDAPPYRDESCVPSCRRFRAPLHARKSEVLGCLVKASQDRETPHKSCQSYKTFSSQQLLKIVEYPE